MKTFKLILCALLVFSDTKNLYCQAYSMGADADGYNIPTGDYSTFCGVWAGLNCNQNYHGTGNGTHNTFIGSQTGYSNLSGSHNSFFGTYAGYANNNGNYNNFLGNSAGYSNTSGSYNNFIGYRAGYTNTIGTDNNFIGYHAGFYNVSGVRNNFMGTYAGYNNSTGNYNNFIGYYSGYKNTTGSSNNFIGMYAGYNNTSGSYNTASSSYALYSNTTGNYNTALGYYSLRFSTTASWNTATGYRCLYSNTTGTYNTAYGVDALYSNTIGENNTAYGWQALWTNVTGSNNTVIGYGADATKDNLKNATAIGYNARVNGSNRVRIGNNNITSIGGQVGWTTFSDGRYKENIKENIPGLIFINKLRPISYTVNVKDLNAYYEKDRKDLSHNELSANRDIDDMEDTYDAAGKIIHNGFIAQEVEAVAKKLNFQFEGIDKPDNKDDLYGLRYENFIVPLVKAVQELSKENDELKGRLDKLEAMLSQQNKQDIELSDKATLAQNIPNPASGTTTIRYNVPSYKSNAYINIYSSSNTLVKSIKIPSKGYGTITLKMHELSSGIYQYALIIDDKIVDTKQMMIAK